MTDDELYKSALLLTKRGHTRVWTGVEDVRMEDIRTGLVFFGDIPQNVWRVRLDAWRADDRAFREWFLIRDRPSGSEYQDDLLGMGVFILEVEDLAKARQEFEAITPQR